MAWGLMYVLSDGMVSTWRLWKDWGIQERRQSIGGCKSKLTFNFDMMSLPSREIKQFCQTREEQVEKMFPPTISREE